MKKFKRFLENIITAIYPYKCICCGDLLDENDYLCEQCSIDIERVNLNDICLSCGLEKSECVCKYSVFRFKSLIAVFKNTGIARTAYYSYKFAKKQHYSKFFAKELANAINKHYSDIEFDFICSVPSFNKFNYDHSGFLAKELSKILNIPFRSDLLSCVKRGKKQHSSTIRERLKNVDNKYFVNYRIENKKVLLIDDIKTTGATIDECTRVLLFAGADDVFCATLLVTSN